jgi:hypothetical protein
MPEPLVVIMIVFAVFGLLLVAAGAAAFRQRRWIGMSAALTLALLFVALAALAATFSVATYGYRALTREVVAAVVVTQPTGPERFTATFAFPDGRQASYELTGNALYVDAHIVKWHPLANVLGLHTAYQLDRVAGRYNRLEDEQRKPRLVFALSPAKPVEMVHLARSFPFLGRVVDAEYGSATFFPAQQPARLELRVSTSGLLFRRANPV